MAKKIPGDEMKKILVQFEIHPFLGWFSGILHHMITILKTELIFYSEIFFFDSRQNDHRHSTRLERTFGM